MKINESGRSMIEMLGVLAIIGVLSVGGIAGYSKAMSKYRVNKTVDQISHIAANTRILFSSQTSYASLGSSASDAKAIIDKAKLFPQEMGVNGNYTNPFQGKVEISKAKRFTADTAEKAFVLTYEGIPEEACVDLATLDWGTGSGGGLVVMGVNEDVSSFTTDGETSCATKKSAVTNGKIACGGDAVMSVTDAVAACKLVDNNKLYFKFY
jgi:Tfp pilus assembly protein PilE